MSKTKKLIIDGNMIAWSNHCSLKNLKVGSRQTGAFYGTLRQIRSFCSMFEPDEVLVLWDVDRSWRKRVYQEYKSQREPDTSLYSQISDVKKALQHLGVNQAQAPGYEADDIAAFLVYNKDADDYFILVSSDKDWFQLIRTDVDVYDPRRKVKITVENFKEKTGYNTPIDLIKSKIILGDPSDNIHGLEGVGPVQFKEYLNSKSKLKGDVDKAHPIDVYLASEQGILVRGLVQLLVPVMDENTVVQYQIGEFDAQQFTKICSEYSCKSLVNQDWYQGFADMSK